MTEAPILGRYRPLAELGQGGHGSVTLAFDTKMRRRVAIKRIPLSRAGVRHLAQTTGLAEARTAALLNHPNIVTVHEWDTDEDEAFLISEYVDGVSLQELLTAFGALDADEAAAVLAPLCAALAFAHANGVLHLDLKPENVLVARDGLVKIVDFGVAALTNRAGQAISAGGTLGYMPAEQLHGEPVDVRTDLWALGALSYEVVTGAVPFASDSIEGAAYKADYVLPPAPTEFVADLPDELDEVLLASVAPDPEERYTSVEEFAADLLGLLGDPEAGRVALADHVDALLADESEPDDDDDAYTIGLWERIAPYEPMLRRAAAALACGWLGWSGMQAVPLGPWAVLAGAGVALVAGALAPPAGLAAGLALLGLGVCFRSPALGVGVLVAALGWWLLVGRRRGWAGFLPAFAPLLSAAGIAPLLPLLTGLLVPSLWMAAAAGALSGALTVVVAIATGAPLPFLHALPTVLAAPLAAHGARLTPSMLLPLAAITLGWAAAAAIMSYAARFATRPSALGGVAAAAVPLVAAVGPWVTGGQRLDPASAMQASVSLILVVIIIALGPPALGDDAPIDDTGR